MDTSIGRSKAERNSVLCSAPSNSRHVRMVAAGSASEHCSIGNGLVLLGFRRVRAEVIVEVITLLQLGIGEGHFIKLNLGPSFQAYTG